MNGLAHDKRWNHGSAAQARHFPTRTSEESEVWLKMLSPDQR
ncbi:hypothetical protein CVCC1112_3089 [Paenarthrobacter nicotinovorans]|nr:hypothetical protein CVCC1112_3089 [Paenarthrobacter nicotinovorans]